MSRIHDYAYKGLTRELQDELSKGIDLNEVEKDGGCALHYACQEGHYDIVNLLLNNSADINIVTEDCDAPLFMATIGGHLDIVKLLIKKGCEIGTEERKEMLLINGVFSGDYKTVEYLFTNVIKNVAEEQYALLYAAQENQIEIAKYLINVGYNVNATDHNNGYTPLFSSCPEGFFEMTKLLLENGANPNHRDMFGSTCLHLACSFGKFDIVEILLQFSADSTIKDEDGKLPIDDAREHKESEIVKLLSK
ncbi:MAG: ankyrin repeat domain-containing protein [candidate division Zixibacteria bacterium]|nr:ankyrin repeat domain-containing protein [candidate division Zixibacteria bacterium]